MKSLRCEVGSCIGKAEFKAKLYKASSNSENLEIAEEIDVCRAHKLLFDFGLETYTHCNREFHVPIEHALDEKIYCPYCTDRIRESLKPMQGKK